MKDVAIADVKMELRDWTKGVSKSWLTVFRMIQVKGGFRSPEDIKKTPFNPDPNPKQLEPNERVEGIRRIQLNDLENLPFFFIAGLLFVLTEPSLLIARCLMYGYIVSRLWHFAAYFTAGPMTPAPPYGPWVQ